MASKSKFKPMLVSFDQQGFERAEHEAKKKLELLDEGSVWIHKQLEVDNLGLDLALLSQDMVRCFEIELLEHFEEFNALHVSAKKLIELKDIPINELVDIQKRFNACKGELSFEKNVPYSLVKRKRFEKWTTNEKQNQRVVFGNQLIKSINDLQNTLGVRVYPAEIIRGTSNFLRFNTRSNSYYINPESIF